MSQNQPDVTPAEDPGGGGGMPAHSIIAAVMELQSLVEWTAQKKGGKEDPAVVNEKLRQLDRIRKELERSAKLQASMSPKSIESSLIRNISEDSKKTEMDFLSGELTQKNIQEFSDHTTVPLICDQDTSYHHPLHDVTHDIRTYSVCAMDDSFNLEDIPAPLDEDNCDSVLQKNDVDLYINFVSAKEEIDKLTMDLEDDVKSSGKVDSRHHATDEPDSLGTAISEDEGLGEESRRADSTGSISFLDIHTSEEDLVDPAASASSDRYAKDVEQASKSDVIWINDPQDPRLSVELCRCTIYKLKECLKAKEEQLKLFREEYKDNSQVKALQTLVNNLKNEAEELKCQLQAAQREKSLLHEQVLELEEAENDARRQCQRYEEKVLFLQEKDVHFQGEFAETKQDLEECLNTLKAKDLKEKELFSQLKYMEVLVQKYEDQIKALEGSESRLKRQMAELEAELLKFQKSKSDVVHKGTQTYPQRAKSKTECQSSVKKPTDSCERVHHQSKLSDPSLRKGGGSVRNLLHPDVSGTSQFSEKGVQVEFIGCSVKENATQTDLDVQACCESRCTMGEPQTPSDNSSVAIAVELSCESTSSPEIETPLSSSCPFQQELFRRLHHLVEEDAHLQQQLHHMDQINLTLWQKLHNLEFHIGECKRENFQHQPPTDEEFRTSDVTSAESIPRGEQSYSQLVADKVFTLKAEEEDNFVGSGKMMSLDFNEEGLRERLLRLEQINSTFEAELRNREKLYQMKEQKHKEWMEAEDRFTCDIQYLQMEKNSLLAKVTQLETEKQRLTNKLLVMIDELACMQERHRRQISLMTEEHEALVSELRSRIELLTKKEKEYVGQISSLRLEKIPSAKREMAVGEKNELEYLKSSYVQLQIELSQNRSNMANMESEFEDSLQTLKQSHLAEEARLEEELKKLREKEADFNDLLSTYQNRQSELEAALCDKEQQLEDARVEFKEQLLAMEEEHRTVEAELNRKLRQMEESTAVATKALTEEKVRLEKELQENLYDLRTKEEQYKSRIAELEANVSQLHVELRRLTGDLDAGFPECNGSEFPPFQKERLQKQLQELQRREGDLREKLEEMEQKEAAYRETLENADRIVASVERGYKNKIEELEMSERSLKQRVNHLEEIESKLRIALHRERRSSDGRKPDDLVLELLEAEVRENTLKERIETLEQSQRFTTHRLKELEKIRESLEAKLADHEEVVASLNRLQQEHDITRKEIAKLRISESGLKLALQQAEGMLKNRESEIRNEMQRMQDEKKDLEETIHQLRKQVRQLQSLIDCNHEEDTSGETLESVHQPGIPEAITATKETEIPQHLEIMKESSTEGDQNATHEIDLKAERSKLVTFQKDCESATDQQSDDANDKSCVFPSVPEQDSTEKTLELDANNLSNGSSETCEQSDGFVSPTVEFFLSEPKKLPYEIIETNIPEPKPIETSLNPLFKTAENAAMETKEAVEIGEDEPSTPDLLSRSCEELHPSKPSSENVPDKTITSESPGDMQTIESSQCEPPELDPKLSETGGEAKEAVIRVQQDSSSASELQKNASPEISSDAQTDGASTVAVEEEFKTPSETSPESFFKTPSESSPESFFKTPLETSPESFSPESADNGPSEAQNTLLLPSSLPDHSSLSGGSETPNTPGTCADDQCTEDSEASFGEQACDIPLLNEELFLSKVAELSSDGSMPADSILKLLRNLKPGTTALDPCTQTGARPKTTLKQACIPNGADSEETSQAEGKVLLYSEDIVDWLRVAEETAYAEEKKLLEDEVRQLRDKAAAIEKEKNALQESLKKVEDVESLRAANAKLQEEVSLLQQRLKMSATSDLNENKKGAAKVLATDYAPKTEEAKSEKKAEQKPEKTTPVSSGFATPSDGAKAMTSSPPLRPPIDECQKERMQLEENMIRAMVAMQFDMKQKKAAKRFNPAYGASDISNNPKSPPAQAEILGACGSDDPTSSTSKTNVHSPYNFRVVQQVGSDTVLVGWEHAHPAELEGFEVYVNGALHETVYTPDRTKAVISGLDLRQQLTLSVCAISLSGDVSEPQLLHLPQRDTVSKDGFFFLDDDDDDDYDDIFYVDEELEKHSRPYSMEW